MAAPMAYADFVYRTPAGVAVPQQSTSEPLTEYAWVTPDNIDNLMSQEGITVTHPNMTSHNVSGYIVSASSEISNKPAWEAFIGGMEFQTGVTWMPSSLSNQYIQMEFPSPTRITGFGLLSPPAGTSGGGVIDATILVSSDGVNFTQAYDLNGMPDTYVGSPPDTVLGTSLARHFLNVFDETVTHVRLRVDSFIQDGNNNPAVKALRFYTPQ
ncbi:discoidin domain-containing protein [Neptuniibacter sp. QD37_11]|uniref:discoidin domain-containing protein n=1 Tax=Neptuniibacter sp. QD37_11 TaxID=3398209 RepID=UPI0039F62EC3